MVLMNLFGSNRPDAPVLQQQIIDRLRQAPEFRMSRALTGIRSVEPGHRRYRGRPGQSIGETSVTDPRELMCRRATSGRWAFRCSAAARLRQLRSRRGAASPSSAKRPRSNSGRRKIQLGNASCSTWTFVVTLTQFEVVGTVRTSGARTSPVSIPSYVYLPGAIDRRFTTPDSQRSR